MTLAGPGPAGAGRGAYASSARAARIRRRRRATSETSAAARKAAAIASPTWPLPRIETSTPTTLPATLATWLNVSETANADDLISSPISRCTVESSASLASPAASAAVNATAIAAVRLKK